MKPQWHDEMFREGPGPPPRRRFIPTGRIVVAAPFIILAALATCTMIFNPIP